MSARSSDVMNDRQALSFLLPHGQSEARDFLGPLLAVLRQHLQMEVAFIGRVHDNRRTFELVDAEPWFGTIAPGASDPLNDSYCGRVLTGVLPNIVTDAGQHPAVADLPGTTELGIGSHVSVPIYTSTGNVYGTLCCFSREVFPDLQEHHLVLMRLFAEVVGRQLEPLADQENADNASRDRFSRVLDEGELAIALQPIVNLQTGNIDAYEALSRFPAGIAAGPDRCFALAHQVGMGVPLEAAAIHAALRIIPDLPEATSLAVNVSAGALIASDLIRTMLVNAPGHQLIVELTEHDQIADRTRLFEALADLRRANVRIAVDDAGSGYAGLERILSIQPEVLKLDRSLVDGIAHHPGWQAMCAAMVSFTASTGAKLVAEGVETQADLDTLRELGVGHAQGYLLGRPALWR